MSPEDRLELAKITKMLENLSDEDKAAKVLSNTCLFCDLPAKNLNNSVYYFLEKSLNTLCEKHMQLALVSLLSELDCG